jgi:hypothetical protein
MQPLAAEHADIVTSVLSSSETQTRRQKDTVKTEAVSLASCATDLPNSLHATP